MAVVRLTRARRLCDLWYGWREYQSTPHSCISMRATRVHIVEPATHTNVISDEEEIVSMRILGVPSPPMPRV